MSSWNKSAKDLQKPKRYSSPPAIAKPNVVRSFLSLFGKLFHCHKEDDFDTYFKVFLDNGFVNQELYQMMKYYFHSLSPEERSKILFR